MTGLIAFGHPRFGGDRWEPLAVALQGIPVAVIERADLLGVVLPLFNFKPRTWESGGRKPFYREADRISGHGQIADT